MPYFDSAFVAKCYLPEPGHAAIVAFAEQSDRVATSLFARTEVVGVFHRKLREGSLTARDFREVLAQFQQDCRAGIWQFLPVSAEIVEAVVQSYACLPGAVFMRAADCLHLIAARGGFCRDLFQRPALARRSLALWLKGHRFELPAVRIGFDPVISRTRVEQLQDRDSAGCPGASARARSPLAPSWSKKSSAARTRRGNDYPEGEACPHCPFWKERDRYAALE